jgi:hypothetical protein
MAMSKKDYVAVANVLNGYYAAASDNKDQQLGIKLIADSLSGVFADDNPRFNRDRFMDAVTRRSE